MTEAAAAPLARGLEQAADAAASGEAIDLSLIEALPEVAEAVSARPVPAEAPARAGERWSSEEDRSLRVRRALGQDVDALAAALGRPVRAVRGRLKRLGLL